LLVYEGVKGVVSKISKDIFSFRIVTPMLKSHSRVLTLHHQHRSYKKKTDIIHPA